MNKEVYVKDLAIGRKVKDVFQLRSFSRREARNGKYYFSFEVGDKTGNIRGVKWDIQDAFLSGLTEGGVYVIDAFVDEYNNGKQLRLNSITPCSDKCVDFSFFLPACERDPQEMVQKIFELLQSVKDPHLRMLIELFREDSCFVDLLKYVPAAKDYHHAYVSGLAEHILSCLCVAELLAHHYPQLNGDLVMAGAFFHDIGKTRELEFQKIIEYSEPGKLIGHIMLGCEIVQEKIVQIPGFPEELSWQIKHLILSHHGEKEFGSPVEPKIIEAQVLHCIDNMDARINMFDFADKKGYNARNGWVFSRSLGRQISTKHSTRR